MMPHVIGRIPLNLNTVIGAKWLMEITVAPLLTC